MKLTKAQRATLREMFGGRCAYCGCELGERMDADPCYFSACGERDRSALYDVPAAAVRRRMGRLA